MAITKPDDLLAAVKAGLDAATPGDWYWDSRNGNHYLCTTNTDKYLVVLGWPCGMELGTFFTRDERGAADAALIANTPTWLRALLKRHQQAEDTLEECRIAQQVSDEVASHLRDQLAAVEALASKDHKRFIDSQAELRAARADLAVNAKLLSHQMDLARQAEIDAGDARAEATRYQELWKCRDDECADLKAEIGCLREQLQSVNKIAFREGQLAERERQKAREGRRA